MTPHIGQRIKAIRRQHKPIITQRQVADAIGIAKRTIIRIELGHHLPKPNTLKLIEMWIFRNSVERGEG